MHLQQVSSKTARIRTDSSESQQLSPHSDLRQHQCHRRYPVVWRGRTANRLCTAWDRWRGETTSSAAASCVRSRGCRLSLKHLSAPNRPPIYRRLTRHKSRLLNPWREARRTGRGHREQQDVMRRPNTQRGTRIYIRIGGHMVGESSCIIWYPAFGTRYDEIRTDRQGIT